MHTSLCTLMYLFDPQMFIDLGCASSAELVVTHAASSAELVVTRTHTPFTLHLTYLFDSEMFI